MSAVDFQRAVARIEGSWPGSDHVQPQAGLVARRVATLLGLALVATVALLSGQVLTGVVPSADLDLLAVHSPEGAAVAAVLIGLWFVSRSGDARVGVAGATVAVYCVAVRPAPVAGSTVGEHWLIIISYAAVLLIGVTAIRPAVTAEKLRRPEQRCAATARQDREPDAAVPLERRGPAHDAAARPGLDRSHGPVFVDLSGRRRIVSRWCGRAVAAACLGYVAIACTGISAVHVGPLIPVPFQEARLPEPDRLPGAPGALEQSPGRTLPEPRVELVPTRSVSVGLRR